MDRPRLFWLRCGYRTQQSWLRHWVEYERSWGAPAATDTWPNQRDPSDPRWREPISAQLTDEAADRLTAEARRLVQRELTWSELLVIERAPWDASRTGVDLAIFNLQLGGLLDWWPMSDAAEPGDLVLVDLAPHGRRDPGWIEADWWEREVRHSAEFLAAGTVHALTHPAWRRMPDPARPLLGVCRVDGTPYRREDRWHADTTAFVPFPAPLATDALSAHLHAPVDADAICPKIWDAAEAEAVLDTLAAQARRPTAIDDARASRVLQRDLEAFTSAFAGVRAGASPSRPRYLGAPLAAGRSVTARRDETNVQAPAAIVLRHTASSVLDLAAALETGEDDEPGPVPIGGWQLRSTHDRTPIGQSPGRAVEEAFGRAEPSDIVVVLEAAFQSPAGPSDVDRRLIAMLQHAWERPVERTDIPLRPGNTVAALRPADGGGPSVLAVPLEDADWLLPELLAGPGTASPDAAGPSAVELATQGDASAMPLRVLAVGDEWLSRRGGISTINRELSFALAEEGATVEVLVGPDETVRDVPTGGPGSVVLTHLTPEPDEDLRARLSRAEPRVLDDVDVIIGHGHVSGPAARRIAERHPNATLVHVVHTDPERIASFKATPSTEDEVVQGARKRKTEIDNCRAAHVVCGVGPKLASVASDLLHSVARPRRRIQNVDRVVQLLPGARAEEVVDGPPPSEQVLTLGRLNDVTKGMDVFGEVIRHTSTRLGRELRWVLRGIAPADADSQQHDARLKSLNALVRPYTIDPDELDGDLRGSTVLCMASREEGFGLVAFEAVVRGVPVLVGKDSGLGIMLAKLDPGDRALVDISADADTLRDVWTARLINVLGAPKQAFREAEERRERVLAHCSWQRTARLLMAAIAEARAGSDAES
jgi:glycosyltransferase involved in cell wall biosynthesis